MKRNEADDFLRGYLDAALFTTVGFWDRGYPDEIADPLTEAAHKFGEHDLMAEDLGLEEKV